MAGAPALSQNRLMPLRDYRGLRIWVASIELAQLVYSLSAQFPHAERFGLTSQMRRAAVSIASNIAEGQGRSSVREFLRFLDIARGSLAEVDTHITIAERLGYAMPEQSRVLRHRIDVIARMLRRLEHALRLGLGATERGGTLSTLHSPPSTTS
jgi:four helix bundle protein